MNGINDCINQWCTKENVDTRILSEWKIRLLHEVRIDSLKQFKIFKVPKKILDDKKTRRYLKSFHKKFVITPTDKACNNFSIVCKKFYIDCLMKELNIQNLDKKKKTQLNRTYKYLKTNPSQIVKRHVKYMEKHNIKLDHSQLKLPFLYWIPKMHKNPSKQRYIAASHSCTTKPLSKMITYCLKLIQRTHNNYCSTIAKNSGYNRTVEVCKKFRQ